MNNYINTRGRGRSAPVPPWSSLNTPTQTWLLLFDSRSGASPCRTVSFSPASCAGSSRGPVKKSPFQMRTGQKRGSKKHTKKKKQETCYIFPSMVHCIVQSFCKKSSFTKRTGQKRRSKKNKKTTGNMLPISKHGALYIVRSVLILM